MAELVNEFQKAVLEGFRDGSHAHLAGIDDYKELQAKLKKSDGLLAALIAELRGVDDIQEASRRMLDADIGAKSAMAAIGLISMNRYKP